MYLLEEWKGKGLGRRLTEGVLPERGDGKARRALVVCLADNQPGRDFYEKMGFTRYARQQVTLGPLVVVGDFDETENERKKS